MSIASSTTHQSARTHVRLRARRGQHQRRGLLLRADRHHERRLPLPVRGVNVAGVVAEQHLYGLHLNIVPKDEPGAKVASVNCKAAVTWSLHPAMSFMVYVIYC